MQKENVLFHQDNAPWHKSMKTMVKLDELSFELLPHSLYSQATTGSLLTWKKCSRERDLAPVKKWLPKQAYFETKDESFDKKIIKKLEKRWNEFITLEGNYIAE